MPRPQKDIQAKKIRFLKRMLGQTRAKTASRILARTRMPPERLLREMFDIAAEVMRVQLSKSELIVLNDALYHAHQHGLSAKKIAELIKLKLPKPFDDLDQAIVLFVKPTKKGFASISRIKKPRGNTKPFRIEKDPP